MRVKLLEAHRLAKNLALMAAIFVSTAVGLRAQTTTMDLTGVGDGYTVGDVYVDPYTATVGGVAGTPVICDDWSNNSYLDETWTATVINASPLSGGTPMFGSNQSLYNELAWLGAQLLASPKNENQQAEISFAMWQLTYGANGTSEEDPSPFTFLDDYGTSTQITGAQGYLCEAGGTSEQGCSMYKGSTEANYNSAGWEILTPVPGSQDKEYSTPQEFMTYVPESSQYAILGADLLLFATAVLILRRCGFLASRLGRPERAL